MLSFINQLYDAVMALETKKFQQYISIFLGLNLAAVLFFGIQFFRKTTELQKRIKFINSEREDTVQDIITDIAKIKHERNAINKILAEDLDFKIAGYFDQVVAQLGIATAVVSTNAPSQVDIDEMYREASLNAKFDGIDMKQITQLLQSLDKNPRIATRKIDITISKKNRGKLQFDLTIVTMLLKSTFETAGEVANE